MSEWITETLRSWRSQLDFWFVFAAVFQVAFAMRFVVQWIASERQKKSVVPLAFWYLSLIGSTGLLIYALRQQQLLFMLGFAFNNVVYVRNLMLTYRHRRANASG